MRINKFKTCITLLPLLVILVVVGNVNAASYSRVNITSNMTQTSPFYSYSSVYYNISLYNITSSQFNVNLPSGIKNVTVTNLKSLNLSSILYPENACHTFSVSTGCEILQLSGVKNGETIQISYSYYQNYSNLNDSFNSTIYFIPSSFTESLNINMILPEGAYIPNNDYNEPSILAIIPANNRLVVEWKLINQSYPNVAGYYINLPFTVGYDIKLKYNKTTSPNYNDIVIPILILAAIILAVSYYYVYKRKRSKPINHKKKSKKAGFLYDLLNADEKTLLSVISKKGFTYQSDIIQKTGFSKIKVSKIIAKLSRYHFIKIKQEGRINKIKRF